MTQNISNLKKKIKHFILNRTKTIYFGIFSHMLINKKIHVQKKKRQFNSFLWHTQLLQGKVLSGTNLAQVS